MITPITDETVKSILKPRASDSNKGTYGTLTCICGSSRFRGAAAMSVTAALRSGAGIVRLASTEKVISACAAKIYEAIYEPLPENEFGGISADAVVPINAVSEISSAVLCGCGMGFTDDTRSIASALARDCKKQLIFDADALNAISNDKSILTGIALPPILTPHIGEMSRLNGMSIQSIKADRAGAAAAFAKRYGCIVVLKDNVTHIASPDGRISVSTAGNAGLARGGSGDILAGIIASMCAQGYDAYDATVCGVHIHGRAADMCAERLSMTGMLPSDIITDLPPLFASLGL